ncbi:hypothetical protein ACERIM_09195 [Natrinema sp. H-ect1]|uniref:hypothetical protein n=1 Tax=Natrinema sp. H-ect1 TaxID=3242700 RepID=UPI00359D1E70
MVLLSVPLIFALILVYAIKAFYFVKILIELPWNRTRKNPYTKKDTEPTENNDDIYNILHERSYRWFFRGLVFYLTSITGVIILEEVIGVRIYDLIYEPEPLVSFSAFLISHTLFAVLTLLLRPFSDMKFADSLIMSIVGVIPGLFFASSLRSLGYILQRKMDNTPFIERVLVATLGIIPSLVLVALYLSF